jgi:thioredoxin 2
MDDVVACPHLGTGNRVPADAVGVPCCWRRVQSLPWVTAAADESFAAVADHASVSLLVDR